MAFKQKSGSPFQRNFGIGSSPAKHSGEKYAKENMMKHKGEWVQTVNPKARRDHDQAHYDGTVDENHNPVEKKDPNKEELKTKAKEAALPMKSSGFKMKSSPFNRNFGIGNSPMKVAGIRPVLPDGSLGDHISSEKAKEIVEEGGKVMKDGMDEVISNVAEVEQAVADPNIGPEGQENYYSNVGENLQKKIDAYEEGDVEGQVLLRDDEGDISDTNFAGRTVQEETTTGEGSDYAKWAEYMGPELAAADKEIQAYVNTHGSSEGMPEHLVEAQKQLTDKANLMRKENIKGGGGDKTTNINYGYGQSSDFIGEDDEEFEYGKLETKEGEGGDYGFGHELTGRSAKHAFQDIELKDGEVVKGGTAAAEEQARLDDIAEKERLAKEEIAAAKTAEAAKKLEAEKKEAIAALGPMPTREDFGPGRKGKNAYLTAKGEYMSAKNKVEARGTASEQYYTYD